MKNWWNNQELHALRMPQVIMHDAEYEGLPLSLQGATLTDRLNQTTLDSMYRLQDEIYRLFGHCEICEIVANTINPAQQNIFIPLKVWRVDLGGCFVGVSIHQRVFDGCFVEFSIL